MLTSTLGQDPFIISFVQKACGYSSRRPLDQALGFCWAWMWISNCEHSFDKDPQNRMSCQTPNPTGMEWKEEVSIGPWGSLDQGRSTSTQLPNAARWFSVVGAVMCHWRMFESIPGIYPLDVNNTSSPSGFDAQNVSIYGRQCPERVTGAKLSSLANPGLDSKEVHALITRNLYPPPRFQTRYLTTYR